MRFRPFCLALLLVPGVLAAQPRRPITFQEFTTLRMVSDPQVSPDGAWVLYAVRTTDLGANRRSTRTYLMPTTGGAARQFPDDKTSASEARWSPDGHTVAYVSGGQLWLAGATGEEPRQLTALTGGATGPVWSPTGDYVAFTSAVYPDCRDDACNAAREKTRTESKVKAHVADQLLYRHWNAYDDGTRSHLFVVQRETPPRDVMPGATYDVPVGPFGGSEGYAFTADGQAIVYTAKENRRDAAWTTDLNLYAVMLRGGAPKVLTASNAGADQNPVMAGNGRLLVYASQRRAGFEADKWRLMAADQGGMGARELLPSWDRNADAVVAAPDGSLLVMAGDRGHDRWFRVTLDAAGRAGAPTAVISDHNNTQLSVAKNGTVAWVRESASAPGEVWLGTLDVRGVSNQHALTHENDATLAQFTLPALEDYWFRGANNDSIHGWVMKPPQWKAGEKFPVLLLIHGGPQGAWLDAWSTRWNYQLFASGGYGLVIINPRGSTGYGQRITDGVSKDWGGKVYTDLMKGLDAALARNPWLDSTRMAAAGGSYGAYMVNWIAGHSKRFKALVSHAGPFNLESMNGATEEQWFVEWEYGGPFWNSKAMAEQYRKWSPHLYAKNFKTPTLVIHGELDYRVPYTEGLSLFTALQRQDVPSRLLVFPDEGHWILKPQNSELWYKEFHGWVGKYLDAKPRM